MIVASVHDPAIFSPSSMAQNMGHVHDRLRTMLHGHLLVLDDSDVIGRAIHENLVNDPNIQMLANAVFRNERIIRVPVNNVQRKKIAQWVDAPGSAEAVALSFRDDVDVCVVDQQTLDAADAEHIDCSRITTLAQYHTTEAWKRENMIFGATPLSEFTKTDFLNKVVQPVVHWATTLTIIDKMIGKSAFGNDDDPNGQPSPNWKSFNETLKTIFDKWNSGPFSGKHSITIITEEVNHYCKDGNPVRGNDLAAELARRLSIPTNRVKIALKSHKQVKDINHDRYLRTNNDFIIGITRGFDLYAADKKLRNADVYLRKAVAKQDVLVDLMNGKSEGVFPAKNGVGFIT